MCKTIKMLLVTFSCLRVPQAFADMASSTKTLAVTAKNDELYIAQIGGFDLVLGIFVLLLGLVAIIVMAGRDGNIRHWKMVTQNLPSKRMDRDASTQCEKVVLDVQHSPYPTMQKRHVDGHTLIRNQRGIPVFFVSKQDQSLRDSH
ncbi:MAG: hypothetical protein HQL78_08560 [Magnetococcales bacterium]|nr:hypothetical protein [Magnetococcales bacterium]MBF0420202.1 hypothetical protein [Magnetococcales bacterium]